MKGVVEKRVRIGKRAKSDGRRDKGKGKVVEKEVVDPPVTSLTIRVPPSKIPRTPSKSVALPSQNSDFDMDEGPFVKDSDDEGGVVAIGMVAEDTPNVPGEFLLVLICALLALMFL